MKKIYIFTIGEYSDMSIYDIACSTPEDADFIYEELDRQNSHDCVNIHEVELYEPKEIPKDFFHDVVSVYVSKRFNASRECIHDYISINRKPSFLYNMHCKIDHFDNHKLNITFFIRNSLANTQESFENNREEIRKIIKKIVSDKITKLQSLFEIEGWTEEMIKETFNYIEEVKI